MDEKGSASGFSGLSIFNELPKHFLVVGKKDSPAA